VTKRPNILVQVLHSNTDPIYSVFAELLLQNPRPDSVTLQFLVPAMDSTNYLLQSGDQRPVLGSLQDNLTSSLIERTLLGLEYFISGTYDFVFRTNLSSILLYPRLLDLVTKFSPLERVYAGYVGHVQTVVAGKPQVLPFCSGAGLLLTKKTAELVLERRARVPHTIVDDLWLAMTLRDIQPIPLERFDIISLCRFDTELLKVIASHIKNSNIHHVRIKSPVSRSKLDPLIYKFLLQNLPLC